MTRVVAIHQPNFLPWLGYFDKLARADVFLMLDDAQFPKKQGNATNRVRLLVGGKAAFVTAPVVRSYHGVRQIREMRIDDTRPWRTKLLKTVETNYRPALHFDQVRLLVTELIQTPTDNLAAFNEAGIRRLASALALDASKLVLSSTLGVQSSGTDRLIELTKAVGGTTYLSGGGADGYQENQKFAEAGLELRYQRFEHPSYSQRAEHPVLGLSIVDALMSCGIEGTRALLA
jgi:hypothetical protein